jgi:hypothetical protein
MIRKIPLLLPALVLSLGCASAPLPIPVAAAPADLTSIVGEWTGEYTSSETGRSGYIAFQLGAGRDTAFGDVVMLPPDYSSPVLLPPRTEATAPSPPAHEALMIRFVGVADGRITGALGPYRDPDCGCSLETRFNGSLVNDRTIEGTFVTSGGPNHPLSSGRWKVTRVKR